MDLHECQTRVAANLERLALTQCAVEALAGCMVRVTMTPATAAELVALASKRPRGIPPAFLDHLKRIIAQARIIRAEAIMAVMQFGVFAELFGVALYGDPSPKLCEQMGLTLVSVAEDLATQAPLTAEVVSAIGVDLVEWAAAMESQR